VRRDLNAVADLVELCFAATLDPEGERYLKQLREAARSASFLRWAAAVADQAAMPLSGFVWEEDGHIVGNLSMIPFTLSGRRCYLIANVATHPSYRRRGIARTLTMAAQERARQLRASATWLQVREDNQPAFDLYVSLGFQERARRSTWYSQGFESGKPEPLPPKNGVTILPRRGRHWPQQEAWLSELYPRILTWHLPLRQMNMQPGLVGGIYRMFNATRVEHWAVQRGERLLAVASWQASYGYADPVWLATPPTIDDTAVQALLSFVRQKYARRKSLTIDFPAHVATYPIQSAGFNLHQNLVWMVSPIS
jgi:ribosomal protein S18 acetylase RimI-like enzyme